MKFWELNSKYKKNFINYKNKNYYLLKTHLKLYICLTKLTVCFPKLKVGITVSFCYKFLVIYLYLYSFTDFKGNFLNDDLQRYGCLSNKRKQKSPKEWFLREANTLSLKIIIKELPFLLVFFFILFKLHK